MLRALGPYALLWVEGVLVLLAAAAALCRTPRRRLVRGPLAQGLHRLAARRPLAVGVVFALSLLGQFLALPLTGVPEPQVHDEFGYLLAARTFAAGRLTNPPHPMWRHLETFHVLQQPTYMSMHPPAQGLALAGGIRLFGSPLAGVWLGVAAACAATCWMLQGFLPPGWALVGGLLAVVRLGVFSYWSTSYWGGGVAMAAGALAVGCVPRIVRTASLGGSVVLGIALAILANARPFEGFVLAVPIAVSLGIWLFREDGPTRWSRLVRVGLPVAVVLALAATGTAFYNRAITGDPLVRPYDLHRQTYAAARHFIWQPPRPLPPIRHELMRRFYGEWELSGFQRTRTARDLAVRLAEKLRNLWLFFVGPALTPALLFLPLALGRKKLRLPAAMLLASLASFLVVAWWLMPHYAAPVAPVLLLFLVEGLRHIRTLRVCGRRVGVGLVSAVLAVCAASAVLLPVATSLGVKTNAWPPAWYNVVRNTGFPRAEILRALEAVPGQHLVFVHYAPGHSPHVEWVFNEPDIDASRVVWAREMGKEEDAELAAHFAGRRIWRLLADAYPPRLEALRAPVAGLE